jgi:carbamoyltransferase
MNGAYLGPSYDDDESSRRLEQVGARFEWLNDDVIGRAAGDLADGKGLGWFQGRMEFGPRALGNRSIIADARSASMQSALNLKVKYRESFPPSRRRSCARTSPTGSSSTAIAPTCCWWPTS